MIVLINNEDEDNDEIEEKVEQDGDKIQQYFTVSDISNALGMEHEEKTMSRVL